MAFFFDSYPAWPENIRRLYFWNLSGAAIGSIILIPILPFTGPGGILLVLLSLSIIAAGLFLGGTKWIRISSVTGLVFIIAAFAMQEGSLDLKEHVSKRSLRFYRDKGNIEFEKWDSTSKIDVAWVRDYLKVVFYDGGTQSSEIYQFDGDVAQLRHDLPGNIKKHFALPRRLSSHALKEGKNQDVLIIGAAGGQEIKAALVLWRQPICKLPNHTRNISAI